MYTQNPNIIYAEIDRGNHFGFYEGESVWDAFTNSTSYTYPPKLALVFFTNILNTANSNS